MLFKIYNKSRIRYLRTLKEAKEVRTEIRPYIIDFSIDFFELLKSINIILRNNTLVP